MTAHLFLLSPGGSCLVRLYPGLAQQVEQADEEVVIVEEVEEEEEGEGGQGEEGSAPGWLLGLVVP